MGNLLFYKDCLVWDDPNLPRSNWIQNLSNAIDKASKHGDQIFTTTDLDAIGTTWGTLLNFVKHNWEYTAFQQQYPWIEQGYYQTLTSIIWQLQGQSPEQSDTVEQLKEEFPQQNNRWLGLEEPACPEPIVFDISTWNKFHSDHVCSFSFKRRCNEFDYFDKFKVERNSVDGRNQINEEITLGQKDFKKTKFLRIDKANPPTEKVQMHFDLGKNINTALNIDGIWKHNDANHELNKLECELLVDMGFLLPDEYYTKFYP